ncbi:hypothetical protein TRFO_19849 [Tritrichomonas foetus]|uniref:Uncharacterized protein n=1 Tax=Tritrichomonas foetus TaxID=1144522 RepID=A0A1J4KHA7_9EUKA|nr:hypothetical protein TRFO_19849 [Tritrichomonas foetus]|eukprot:OHT10791.1 hypothetical protein TRFO_19849 [Tritrichomonas foetus]
MVSLLEVYLQKKKKKNVFFFNAGSGQPRLYNKKKKVFFFCISKFTVDNTNADVAIIYDSHYTPPMKKRAI